MMIIIIVRLVDNYKLYFSLYYWLLSQSLPWLQPWLKNVDIPLQVLNQFIVTNKPNCSRVSSQLWIGREPLSIFQPKNDQWVSNPNLARHEKNHVWFLHQAIPSRPWNMAGTSMATMQRHLCALRNDTLSGPRLRWVWCLIASKAFPEMVKLC